MKKVIQPLLPALMLLLIISFGLSTAHAKDKYKSAKATMDGSCLILEMITKKACDGTVRVGWYNAGEGYWITDSYSMIKNGRETIKGSWDKRRAEIGKGPFVSAAISSNHGGQK